MLAATPFPPSGNRVGCHRVKKDIPDEGQDFFNGKEGPQTDGSLLVSTDALRGSLRLTNLSTSMSGVYVCNARNEVGSAHCNVTLEVSTGQCGVSAVKEKLTIGGGGGAGEWMRPFVF